MDAKYVELATRIGLGQSERIPKLFQMLADPAEADILLALPANAPVLAEKLGWPEPEIAESLNKLFVRGVVFPGGKTTPPTYRLTRDFVQFHDATILWPGAPQAFYDLWQELMEVEWPDMAKFFSQIITKPFMRVIPVGVTVQANNQVLAFEDVKEVIETARRIAVTKCTCRLIEHKCDRPLENCLQINKAADYAITRGTGRELTKPEALEIVREAEEVGLIHTAFNQKSVDLVICNCCGCCCQTMPLMIKYGLKLLDPSRYHAQVQADLCTACETCLERCYFGAITMTGENEIAEIDPEKCIGCGLCQVTCPSEAINLIEVRDVSFVPDKFGH